MLTISGHVAYIVGSWIYRTYLRDVRFRSLLKNLIWTAFWVGMTTIVLVKRCRNTHYKSLTLFDHHVRWNLAVHLPDHVFVLGDTVFLAVCGYILRRDLRVALEMLTVNFSQISFMPVLVLSAKISPKGAEGTIYNSMMSIYNLGCVISEFSGGLLTKWLGVGEDNFEVHIFH